LISLPVTASRLIAADVFFGPNLTNWATMVKFWDCVQHDMPGLAGFAKYKSTFPAIQLLNQMPRTVDNQ
jgi:hypothetical protein